MAFCQERKRLLSGGEVTYECELVTLQKSFGILRYVLDSRCQVGSLTLLPGMVSYGFYWTGRPYTLYLWWSNAGDRVGYYFNLADSIHLSERVFAWRDLALDILVHPAGRVEIIDEEQIPSQLDEGLRAYIESAKELVLQDYRSVIEEANEALKGVILREGRDGIY